MRELQFEDDDFQYWRSLTAEQALVHTQTTGWETHQDDYGRNAVMNALYCFSPAPVVQLLLDEAHRQQVFDRMCRVEDWVGVRLPAYALRETTLDIMKDEFPWKREIFRHGVINSRGVGLLGQLLARSECDDTPPDDPLLLLRQVAFSHEDLACLRPEDWCAGVDEEALVPVWARAVMSNDAILGLSTTTDFDAMKAWLLPLFLSTPRTAWSPAVADCLDTVHGLVRLLELPDTPQSLPTARSIVRDMEQGLRRLLPFERPRRRRAVEYHLNFSGWGEAWDEFLARVQADALLAATHPVRDPPNSTRRV